jgi:hypothetical protein
MARLTRTRRNRMAASKAAHEVITWALMSRFGVVVFVAIWAQGVSNAQEAPLSPFDLAQSVDSVARIDWNSAWKRLGRTDEPPAALHCGDPRYSPCSAEVITVLNPAQVILLLTSGSPVTMDYYLRFSNQADTWKFTGYYEAFLRYYDRRHELMRFGDRPFLKISVQGASGTGVASEIEEWFDLTQVDFDPVFSFPVQGHVALMDRAIGREFKGFASQDRRSNVESIDVTLNVRFTFEDNDLGDTTFSGVYERPTGKAKFSLQRAYAFTNIAQRPAVPNMSNGDFEKMADIEGTSIERLLAYALPGLKRIALSDDEDTKEDLRALLKDCQDTAEKQELEKALSGKE